MDLRQLTYFSAVAEVGHLGRAAERLHLSQPPLSRHIHALEEELGVVLFDRKPQGMTLTAAGVELLKHARSMLEQVTQATEDTRRVARGERGLLDVGLYGSAIYGVVPKVLEAFRQRFPEVEIRLHHAQTPQQIDPLRKGRVMLVFERLLPLEPDIEVVHVARERLYVAMSASHALAKQETILVGDLAQETILLGSSPSATAMVHALCHAHGFEPRFGPPATDVVIAALMASADRGVSLVPESMINVSFPNVTYRPLDPTVAAHMDLHCFYLRGTTSPLLFAMLETIQAMRNELHA